VTEEEYPLLLHWLPPLLLGRLLLLLLLGRVLVLRLRLQGLAGQVGVPLLLDLLLQLLLVLQKDLLAVLLLLLLDLQRVLVLLLVQGLPPAAAAA
jgi:hypothetical protein